jgi:TubC N-terminal docking domain
MTAEQVLLSLSCGGASVSVTGDRLRVEAPQEVLTPSIREGLAAHEVELLRLVGLARDYRALLCKQARLIDDLGPRLATAVLETMTTGAAR